jgi:hypothetical protein
MVQLNYSGGEVDIRISNRTAIDLAFRILNRAGEAISQTGYVFTLTVRKANERAAESVLVLDGEVSGNRIAFPYTSQDVANIKQGIYYFTILKANEASVNTFLSGKFIITENLT